MLAGKDVSVIYGYATYVPHIQWLKTTTFTWLKFFCFSKAQWEQFTMSHPASARTSQRQVPLSISQLGLGWNLEAGIILNYLGISLYFNVVSLCGLCSMVAQGSCWFKALKLHVMREGENQVEGILPFLTQPWKSYSLLLPCSICSGSHRMLSIQSRREAIDSNS